MKSNLVDAIVLGGGNAKGLADVPAKGLVPINSRPMVEYVVEALRRCDGVDRICVVLPIEFSPSERIEGVDYIVANGSLPAVTKAGIDFLNTGRKLLILSADIPLLSAEAVSDFLERCKVREAGFYYPIVRFGESEKRFPDVKRTYVKVREGRFTGGNIGLIDSSFVTNNMDFIDQLYELRKKPVKMARLLGFSFLIKFVLGLLTIRQVEERFGRISNTVCAGVVTPYIEIGMDVDKESDLRIAVQAITGGA